jgi:hypothetical protein
VLQNGYDIGMNVHSVELGLFVMKRIT